MNYLYLILIVVIGIFPAISAAGENDRSEIIVFPSFTDISCGAWARSQKDEPTRQVYLYWFRGFVSGFNYGSETKTVPLNATPDPDTLSLYVDKYCREHPLLPFISAAVELVNEISVKK